MGEIKDESPNIMYGRLKEAVNISGYSLERAMQEFDWLLDNDRWKKVEGGFDDINDFLKTINLSEFKIAVDQRKKISLKLSELQASQRATAEALGVAHTTLQRDIKSFTGTNVPIEQESATNNEAVTNSTGTSVPVTDKEPDWMDESPQKMVSKKANEEIKKKEKIKKIESTQKERADDKKENAPIIYNEDCANFLNRFEKESIDLLITDPPYSTDIEDLPTFLDTWLYDALDKIKDTGRAFICIGAYPIELYTYLGYLLETDWIVDNPLIWTYRNTLGVTPKMKYNLNYQVILHLYKESSKPLDNRITNEMFSVQDINAPDGRIGDRYHKWQKPIQLGERLIIHTTNPGDKVIDPFACTGTFLLAAGNYNRIASGCDIDNDAINIAIERGCVNEAI